MRVTTHKQESVIKASSPALLIELIFVILAKEALVQEHWPEWSQESVITPQNSIITLWASLSHQWGVEPMDFSSLSKHRPAQQDHTEENHRQVRKNIRSAQTRPQVPIKSQHFFQIPFFLSCPSAAQPPSAFLIPSQDTDSYLKFLSTHI